MRLLHAVAFTKKLRWLTQTKVISLKTQPHAVNACVKRSSQLSFTKYEAPVYQVTVLPHSFFWQKGQNIHPCLVVYNFNAHLILMLPYRTLYGSPMQKKNVIVVVVVVVVGMYVIFKILTSINFFWKSSRKASFLLLGFLRTCKFSMAIVLFTTVSAA